MSIAKIEKPDWKEYCDRLSETLTGTNVEIEIDSLDIGHQIEAKWLPFLGIVYEPKKDTIEILLEGLDHLIHHPRELYAEHDAIGLSSLEVVTEDDVRRIVQFRRPIMLAPPPPASLGNRSQA